MGTTRKRIQYHMQRSPLIDFDRPHRPVFLALDLDCMLHKLHVCCTVAGLTRMLSLGKKGEEAFGMHNRRKSCSALFHTTSVVHSTAAFAVFAALKKL
jgi:hypothetical protein